jgi:hypothetical protein
MEFRRAPDTARLQLRIPFDRSRAKKDVMSRILRSLPFAALLLHACTAGPSASRGADTARNEAAPQKSAQLLLTKAAPGGVLVADFYGEAVETGGAAPVRMIDHLVIRDKASSRTVVYKPDTPTRQAADFFFAEIWSPDGRSLVLPLDKKDGFAFFEVATAMRDVAADRPSDRIRIWNGAARKYWHGFSGWDGPHAIRFTAELDGTARVFRYDLAARTLTCIDAPCSTNDSAANLAGKVPRVGNTATR